MSLTPDCSLAEGPMLAGSKYDVSTTAERRVPTFFIHSTESECGVIMTKFELTTGTIDCHWWDGMLLMPSRVSKARTGLQC